MFETITATSTVALNVDTVWHAAFAAGYGFVAGALTAIAIFIIGATVADWLYGCAQWALRKLRRTPSGGAQA